MQPTGMQIRVMELLFIVVGFAVARTGAVAHRHSVFTIDKLIAFAHVTFEYPTDFRATANTFIAQFSTVFFPLLYIHFPYL